ncbi:TetR/AcrR family transcriptional regulator [Sphingobium sp. EM0848]|uniref:TetR/AcrR family transcriptional regulator n=1 Tax=Sphingobium sp. EM0848 TaxID=2743473 RepID=UPI00159CB7F8|nr:TetR/AcrR family transcriptional regulator [Sphingobium sp. EM0848]
MTGKEQANRQQGGERYASATMLERRKRILAVTRDLVAEQGIDGFSINALCRRADVAKQTLYNAFGTKDELIAAAILDYFEDYERHIPYRSAVGTLDRLIERMVAVGTRNLAIPNYIKAITGFYFSASPHPELRETLHNIFSAIQAPYVKALAASASLHPWVDPERLIESLDEQRMLVAAKWARGELSDEEFINGLVMGVLTILLGVSRGEDRDRILVVAARICEKTARAYVESLPGVSSD